MTSLRSETLDPPSRPPNSLRWLPREAHSFTRAREYLRSSHASQTDTSTTALTITARRGRKARQTRGLKTALSTPVPFFILRSTCARYFQTNLVPLPDTRVAVPICGAHPAAMELGGKSVRLQMPNHDTKSNLPPVEIIRAPLRRGTTPTAYAPYFQTNLVPSPDTRKALHGPPP